ncbi:MAG: hypothetical protein CK426_09340, partial [Legionella sp.]
EDQSGASAITSAQSAHDLQYYQLHAVPHASSNCYELRDSYTHLQQTHLSFILESAESFESLNAHCHTLVVFYILRAFVNLDLHYQVGEQIHYADLCHRSGIHNRYYKAFRYFLSLLVEANYLTVENDYWVVINPLVPPIGLYQEAKDQLKNQSGAAFLSHCGAHLTDILREQVRALDIVFSKEDEFSAVQIYQEDSFYDAINHYVGHLVSELIRLHPQKNRVRILEVGAGTGSTTRHILSSLQDMNIQIDYVYTDVSCSFLQEAAIVFADFEGVHYQLLDLERSGREQYFAPNQFDIVIAANVLHATKSIKHSLDIIKNLMKKHAYLVLVETTDHVAFNDLTFGLLDGWWNFNDERLANNSPLLSVQGWTEVLQSSGFATEVVCNNQAAQSIITGQLVELVSCAVWPAEHWLLLHDTKEFAHALQATLNVEQYQLTCIDTSETDFEEVWSRHGLKTAYTRIIYASLDDVAIESTLPKKVYSHSMQLLTFIQTAIRHYSSQGMVQPRIDLVIRESLVHSALWGIGRTAQQEYKNWSIRLIGWDGQDDYAALAYGLWVSHFESPEEHQLRLGFKGREVYRLLSVTQTKKQTGLSMPEEGVYLITGGLSGIGYQLCQWLIEKGVRHIALLSRRQATPEQELQFSAWLQRGIDVCSYSVDVGDKAALCAVYETIKARQGAVKHVIHGAGLLSDATLLNQTPLHYETVYKAKVYGAWYLHEVTCNDELNSFTVFSSATAFLGTPGQSNHAAANVFLDQLIAYRHEQGLHGLSIQWGLWQDTGNGLNTEKSNRLYMQPIDFAEGLRAFHSLFSQQSNKAITAISVMSMDWQSYQNRLGNHPLLSALLSVKPVRTEQNSLMTELELLSFSKASILLQDRLMQLLKQLLRYEQTDGLNFEKGFFDLGMDSLIAIEFGQRIERLLEHKAQIKTQTLFDYPTINSLTDYLLKQFKGVESDDEAGPSSLVADESSCIAIISMDCRFPGECNSPEQYWDLLQEARNVIVDYPASRQQSLVAQGGFISNIELFDADYFNISPKEARLLDPQQRLLLEVADTLFQRATIAKSALKQSNTGVFIGLCSNDYAHSIKDHIHEADSAFYFSTGNAFSTASGRLSFYYGLEGPSLTVDTACSSSLVSVHLACQSLRSGECKMAIAGGVNLIFDAQIVSNFKNSK